MDRGLGGLEIYQGTNIGLAVWLFLIAAVQCAFLRFLLLFIFSII